jgi:hypothetical protein
MTNKQQGRWTRRIGTTMLVVGFLWMLVGQAGFTLAAYTSTIWHSQNMPMEQHLAAGDTVRRDDAIRWVQTFRNDVELHHLELFFPVTLMIVGSVIKLLGGPGLKAIFRRNPSTASLERTPQLGLAIVAIGFLWIVIDACVGFDRKIYAAAMSELQSLPVPRHVESGDVVLRTDAISPMWDFKSPMQHRHRLLFLPEMLIFLGSLMMVSAQVPLMTEHAKAAGLATS